MPHDELILSPFERSIVGPQGAVILRRNQRHAEECAARIRRRKHPGWSQFDCSFRVSAEGCRGISSMVSDV
jgi:hypothetical protein